MAAIELDWVTKRYGDLTAVDDLDLRVHEGEIYGFLGPNGAGKSTTIDLLLDFARPTSGEVRILGHNAQRETLKIRRRIGVLPEGYGLYKRLTGRRNLEFAIDWQDADDDPATLLKRVGLDSQDAVRPVGEYSKGMTQRVALAMALVGSPDLIILDEPSSGLDPNGIRLLREIVREEANQGATVFFSSHLLGQIEAVCDRVGILNDGNLVAVDTVEGLREAAGARSTFELLLGDASSVTIDTDGIEDIETRGNRLRMSCVDPRAKAQVVTELVNAGHEVIDISSESASLEALFTAYTGSNPTTATGDESETKHRTGPSSEVNA